MRFTLPPPKLLAEINGHLEDFFTEHDEADLTSALDLLCAFYDVAHPRVLWRRTIDRGVTLGITYHHNTLHLIRPAVWVTRKRDNTEEEWIETFWHEWYHVVHYVDDETKADQFARLCMEVAA